MSGATSNTEGSDGGNRVRIEQRLLIHFLAKKEFWAKLEEVKALLSNKMPGSTFEEVFEVLMNEFIDRHSPAKRTQRRETRRAMRTKKVEKQNENHADKRASKNDPKHVGERPRQRDRKRDAAEQSKNNGFANKSHNPGEKANTQKRTRHIPIALRDKVFARDNARCTYVGKNGKRCGSTHNLQIDHIKPFARGGQNTLSNLRLLCGKHNRHEAKRILGSDVMNQYNKRE